MTLFEKVYFAIFLVLGIASLIYWENLAWFHPDKLKEKYMKRVERNPDWLFFKGYSLRFSKRYGISMIRLVTLMGALMLLVSGILFVLGRLGIGT